ncbi:transcriptional regulator family: Fungal Specific TF [Trichoderma harzianum]|nr:transcriptional regulator family: Fungal Specific TF [Trichoderma harzianum]
MPRPKVHPSQRQRAAEACNFCRASKKRCSATVPCTACQRRGIGDSCYLTHRPRGSRRVPPRTRSSAPEQAPTSPSGGDGIPDSLDASLDQLPQESAWGRAGFGQVVAPEWCPEDDPASMDNDADADYQPLTPSDSRISMSDATTNRSAHPSTQLPARQGSPALEPESHARMLLNLRGERGKASYHHLSTLYKQIDDELIPASRIVYIGEAASLSFLQLIRDTVTAQIGPSQFSHNEKRDSMLETEPSAVDSNGLEPANCNIDLEGSLLYARTFEAATGGLLDIFGPTEIEDVLLKTGTDGAQSLSPCQHAAIDLVIAIGAQCKSPMDAQQIGPAYFRQAQQRAFAGMLEDPNIDMASHLDESLCLGYAKLDTSIIASYQPLASRPDSRTASLFASYKILTIINESIDALYGRKVVSTGMVESFLNKIEDWSKGLPSFLRNPLTSKGSPSQKAATDSIHVACLYYFAITLVTRPILISRLTSRRNAATPSSSPMASACLDAAVYLVQTCSEAHKSGLLLGNMCILKALIFAAGLILGFDMFAKRELDYEVEVAFRSAKDVLDFLGIQSPQASHYSEILGLLSNAITKRRMKLSSRPRSRYVGKLVSFSDRGESGQDNIITDNETLPLNTGGLSVSVGEIGGVWSADLPAQSSEMDEDMLRGWDSLDLSQWDSFPFFNPRSFWP